MSLPQVQSQEQTLASPVPKVGVWHHLPMPTQIDPECFAPLNSFPSSLRQLVPAKQWPETSLSSHILGELWDVLSHHLPARTLPFRAPTSSHAGERSLPSFPHHKTPGLWIQTIPGWKRQRDSAVGRELVCRQITWVPIPALPRVCSAIFSSGVIPEHIGVWPKTKQIISELEFFFLP